MNLNIVINTGSATPIYKQITDQVRLAVATGKLAVGDQLSSVRALAEELVVNPNTVARAYTDLAREGLIESRAGRGVFVTRKRKMFTREEGRRRLEPLMDGSDRRSDGDGLHSGGAARGVREETPPVPAELWERRQLKQ